MKAVSNTSPLIFLAKTGLLETVFEVFQVCIPKAVETEVVNPKFSDSLIISKSISLGKIKVLTAKPLEISVLHEGETQAISLAREINADVLLMDESKGRRIARQLGIKTLGTLGIIYSLLSEKKIGKTHAINAINALKQNKHYLHPLLLDAFIEKINAKDFLP